ncbi:hypothetical protein J7E26_12800 [Bacillus sp. ISL-51]|uniref:hypothetical protein n=1 Tax=Bacteria TaxID=2 RepID=UPI001BE97019|nr:MULTISPECIES: hypothetical protein [Bacteria]MBT2574821.1 hypothetical protein [Bacillus sp. ISL-51]MBT2635700.1 hypothetical protein [Bacillus sp. ISL-26]MBT2714222.1 hypothetical protein [Pseudomonas sp. ISL-88]
MRGIAGSAFHERETPSIHHFICLIGCRMLMGCHSFFTSPSNLKIIRAILSPMRFRVRKEKDTLSRAAIRVSALVEDERKQLETFGVSLKCFDLF